MDIPAGEEADWNGRPSFVTQAKLDRGLSLENRHGQPHGIYSLLISVLIHMSLSDITLFLNRKKTRDYIIQFFVCVLFCTGENLGQTGKYIVHGNTHNQWVCQIQMSNTLNPLQDYFSQTNVLRTKIAHAVSRISKMFPQTCPNSSQYRI